MLEYFGSFLRNRWPELLGIVITLTSGLIMPWLSRKSSNYKKINKRMIGISLLHLLYLSLVPGLIMIIGALLMNLYIVIIGGVESITTLFHAYMFHIISYVLMTAASLLGFFWLMRKSKRMKIMMGKTKELGKSLYIQFTWVAIASIILTFASTSLIGTPLEEMAFRIAMIISWIIQIWWLILVAVLVWKVSEYVYSNIKVTMLDGNVYDFDCSPKVCRVYRNYIRIRKRDESNVVIQELHINESAIKQIEYSK